VFKLPKSAGILEFDFSDTDEPAIRKVDVYEAREWFGDRISEITEECEDNGLPKPKTRDVLSQLASEYLGQDKEDWPTPRASAFWTLVLDEVGRLGKAVSA